PLDRVKTEYRNILAIPENSRIVKVFDASVTPDGVPYIVFEYIDGLDLSDLIEQRGFSPEDVLTIGKNVAEGLVHLHNHGVYHCDIKPNNLIWTTSGARIIDFNVSSRPALGNGFGGGTKRYLPPDLDLTQDPDEATMADRDLYALGITLYEALTGKYPWDSKTPPLGIKPKNPSDFAALSDLTPSFTNALLKLIAPQRAERFGSASEFLDTLNKIPYSRQLASTEVGRTTAARILKQGKHEPNSNPFVDVLVTFYSQSVTTNAGTRGLDENGKLVYVETALDRDLRPAVLNGEFNLVIITGNAGDGKTAFLQQLEEQAKKQNAVFQNDSAIGTQFVLNKRKYLINYDGSQDQENVTNDEVLNQFFSPFAGSDPSKWPTDEARLIAINEGRLCDFLTTNIQKFPKLSLIVDDGLKTGKDTNKIAIINLNSRCVVAPSEEYPDSIFVRLIKKIITPDNWRACDQCNLKEKCYIFHNILSIQDETAGQKIIQRLELLFTFAHLRGQFHITLRDLRSALAFLITSNRTCEMVHKLFESGKTDEILQSYYYTSWMGGDQGSNDRLLKQLSEIDVGQVTNPQLDRRIDFAPVIRDQYLFNFPRRNPFEEEILVRYHGEIPRDLAIQTPKERMEKHRQYLKLIKRRIFFERRDDSWKKLLPYRHGELLAEILHNPENIDAVRDDLIKSINRGEGISSGGYTHDNLVLKVSPIDKGSIRSYRIFPKSKISLKVIDHSQNSRFIEQMPANLQLNYENNVGLTSSMLIDLDTFEMLCRLNEGYAPTVEQLEGYCLRLEVFKNLLSSAPYQEILLTITGHDFYQITRNSDGRLQISSSSGGLN
ncbi:MAG: serine/threonine protein kinase, partial [Flavobacteriales bacterium]|nr:serine/threonine protein kinase [Flavobacteriales bacterium]